MFSKLLQRQKFFLLSAIFLFWGGLLFFHQASYNYWSEFIWMFPVAFFVALTVNTIGISGAALFVPFFILIFPLFAVPLSAEESVKIGLITESFGLSSSALAFLAYGLVDKKLAFYSVIGALPFVIVGTFFVLWIPQSILLVMIASLLIVSILLVKYRNRLKKKRMDELASGKVDYSKPRGELVLLVSKDHKKYSYCRTKAGYKKRFWGYGLGGIFQGSAGFGIGELGIISMMLSDIPTRIAIGTSHLVVAGTAIVASLIHIILSSSKGISLHWNLPFVTVPAVVLGGQLAPLVASKLRTKFLEKIISLLFFTIAAALIILAVRG